MAAETFRISIPIRVEDNTDPGVGKATGRISAFDRQNEKTQKRLNEMNKTKWKVALEAIDKVSSVVGQIGSKVSDLTGRAWRFTVSVIDKVTAPLRSMISGFTKLLGISSAVSTVLAGLTIKNALEAASEKKRYETQLTTVYSNVGGSPEDLAALMSYRRKNSYNRRPSRVVQKDLSFSDRLGGAAMAPLIFYEGKGR